MSIILETPRLRMREFTEADLDNLLALNSDPEVMRYLSRAAPREVIRREVEYALTKPEWQSRRLRGQDRPPG